MNESRNPLWIASNPAAFMILLEDHSQGAISARLCTAYILTRSNRPAIFPGVHVPTSLRRRRLVERRGLRVKEWRLVERRRRLRSWTRSWRRVNLLAMNEDCDALMQFANFCPESLSACNANKVLPCCVTSALLAIATLQKEVERIQKYQKIPKMHEDALYIKQLLCTPN